MGDNFDPCECIWNHEFSMRRLLSFIRNSQSYCTDTECFPDGPNGTSQGMDENLFFMMFFFAFAMFMYLMRPSASRNQEYQDIPKPRMNDDGSSDMPPRPPPANL